MRLLTRRTDKATAAPPRRARRWWRRALPIASSGAGLLALALGGFWLQHSGIAVGALRSVEERLLSWSRDAGLAVKDVQVEGREQASREAILAALDVARGMPLLAVDAADAKRRLEAIPWVRSASVERRLPDTLFVHIVERQPLAFWQRQGKLVLIDRDGVTITGEHLDRFGNLIVLVGGDAPAKGADLLDMLATEPALASRVAAAVRVGGRRWNLHLDSGIDIALPEEGAATAWHRLATLEHSDGILERNLQMVDMRLPDRLVVRTIPEPKAAPKKGRQPGKST
jgi:cell division protein FtsQ